MEKITNKVLDNGLRVIIVENKEKYNNKASIIIKAGGDDISYKKDGKEYPLKKGSAHFLEHYLIENAKDGNMGEYFASESITFNGCTSGEKTEFYIITVHDFIYNLKKLLKMVNKPVFDERIDKIKKPIIEEIKRAEDNKFRRETKKKMDAFYSKLNKDITLGSIEDIETMSVNNLKEFYKAFYRPNNEIISIYTNQDSDKLLKLIEKEYSNYKYVDNIERNISKEDLNVRDDKVIIVDKDDDEYLELLFKIDVKDIEPVDRIKINVYLEYFLKVNFGEESPLFKELIDNKLSLYSVSYNNSFINDQDVMYLSLMVYVLDSKFEIVKEKLLKIINNMKYNKEDFIFWRNNYIIRFIDNEEHLFFKNSLLIDSIVNYNCEYLETIDDIKAYNLEEALKLLRRLKFNKFVDVRRIKGE